VRSWRLVKAAMIAGAAGTIYLVGWIDGVMADNRAGKKEKS